MRPDTHWRRFWAALRLIIASLMAKQEGGQWAKEVSRQRQQYWWRGYRIQSHVQGSPATELPALVREGIMAATHSLSDRAVTPWPQPPHPSLAETGPPGPP